jgi:hypothetical protein
LFKRLRSVRGKTSGVFLMQINKWIKIHPYAISKGVELRQRYKVYLHIITSVILENTCQLTTKFVQNYKVCSKDYEASEEKPLAFF